MALPRAMALPIGARSVALATGSVISSSVTSRPSSVTNHRSVIPTTTIGAAAYAARIRGSSCSADSVVSLIWIRSICSQASVRPPTVTGRFSRRGVKSRRSSSSRERSSASSS